MSTLAKHFAFVDSQANYHERLAEELGKSKDKASVAKAKKHRASAGRFRGLAKRWGIPTNPFQIVETIDSKDSRILQGNDVMIGAISHAKNQRHLRPEARLAKYKLAEHLRLKVRIRSLSHDVEIGANRFSIWNILLQKQYTPKP